MTPIKLAGHRLKLAQGALKVIRLLRDVILEGTNYKEYSAHLKKVGPEVKKRLAPVPHSDFRKEVKAAMAAFNSAGGSWNFGIKNKSSYAFTANQRQSFWKDAIKHTRNAEGLLK